MEVVGGGGDASGRRCCGGEVSWGCCIPTSRVDAVAVKVCWSVWVGWGERCLGQGSGLTLGTIDGSCVPWSGTSSGPVASGGVVSWGHCISTSRVDAVATVAWW